VVEGRGASAITCLAVTFALIEEKGRKEPQGAVEDAIFQRRQGKNHVDHRGREEVPILHMQAMY